MGCPGFPGVDQCFVVLREVDLPEVDVVLAAGPELLVVALVEWECCPGFRGFDPG